MSDDTIGKVTWSPDFKAERSSPATLEDLLSTPDLDALAARLAASEAEVKHLRGALGEALDEMRGGHSCITVSRVSVIVEAALAGPKP